MDDCLASAVGCRAASLSFLPPTVFTPFPASQYLVFSPPTVFSSFLSPTVFTPFHLCSPFPPSQSLVFSPPTVFTSFLPPPTFFTPFHRCCPFPPHSLWSFPPDFVFLSLALPFLSSLSLTFSFFSFRRSLTLPFHSCHSLSTFVSSLSLVFPTNLRRPGIGLWTNLEG